MKFIEYSRRLGPAIALAVTVFACSDPAAPAPTGLGIPPAGEGFLWANSTGCGGNAPAVSLPAAQHDSLPPLVPYSFYTNDEWQRIAEHVPGGWAGAYLEGNRLVLMFVDTTHLSSSLAALATYWSGQRFSFAREDVVIRVVRWNWIQLNDWYRYITLVAGLPDGWSFSDIDEGNNRLEFGAATAADRDVLLARLSELHTPCWLAAVTIQGYAVPLSPEAR